MLPFFRSFVFAFRGLALCLRERNFRFHLALSAYMFGYLTLFDWFRLTRAEWAILILAAAAVLSAEALNTAVEAAVDLASPDRHPLAARAKDVAATAVLRCAVGAVAAGVALLYQPAAFAALAGYYRERPWMLAVLAGTLVPAGLFIFRGKRRKGS